MVPKLAISSTKYDENESKNIENDIYGLLSSLAKAHSSLIPVVYAIESDYYSPTNKKRYKDLPVYDSCYSPQDECYLCSSCLNRDQKILHARLFSTVRKYRKKVQNTLIGMKDGAYEAAAMIDDGLCNFNNAIKDYFRQDCRYLLRQGLVAAATGTGLYFGSPRRGLIYRRLIGGTIGYVASGYLCFPYSTGKIVNEISYQTYKTIVPLLNWWFNTGIQLIEHSCECPPKCPGKRQLDKCDSYNEEKRKKEYAIRERMESCRKKKEQEELAKRIKDLCTNANERVADAEKRFEEERLEIQHDLMEKIKYEEAIEDRKVEMQNRKLKECKKKLNAKKKEKKDECS